MVMGDNGIDDYKKCRQIDDDFDRHAAGGIWRDAHPPMECIRGFMQSHYMPPSGKCSCLIAPAAAMVDDFEKKKNTNKTQLSLSFLMVDRRKKTIKYRGPPGTLYSRPWHDKPRDCNPYPISQVEELSYILSY